eukprot:3777475-Rhodomonas_salina.1
MPAPTSGIDEPELNVAVLDSLDRNAIESCERDHNHHDDTRGAGARPRLTGSRRGRRGSARTR